MKTIPVLTSKVPFMKSVGLIALLLMSPLAGMAQYIVFTDNFSNGSTTNHTSVPGGTPFASFTSYDVAASKAATTGTTINPSDLKIALNGATSSGLLEVQAVFTKAPITLVNVGDSINLTYIFRMTNGLPTVAAYLGQGLYNSAGVPPVAGGLNNSGLGTGAGSPFATGNCQAWQGYFSRILSLTNAILTRPVQNGNASGTTSANQDLLGSGVSGGFTNPGPATVGTVITPSVSITTGAYYTISYTITLTDTNTPTLTITSVLFNGVGTNGTVLSTETATATGANYLTNSFDSIAFGRRDTGGSSVVTMDITNITISENLAGLPGQPFDVTGGGTGCIGSAFPVGLDGSVSSNTYYLYTNGVWTGNVQPGTGSALNFGNESIISVPLTNTVVASNTMSGATGLMLGSVLVGPFALPVITNQPTPVIVANGSVGVFSLGASGGGLTYQWYKNGSALTDGGDVSGSLTSTLLISPASSGDVGNYNCVVTDGCNFSTNSTTNALTLDSPAGLVWQGGNPNTNWDLSITPNFNSGSAVFHNGDNVTFDDTASVFTLSIANNYIAPTTITEKAANRYIFNGPGVIIGPGALVMNGSSGSGTLSINNANAYTGGTTVSGGTLIMSNLNAFGSGNITLTGGTFDYPFSPGTATGLSNNINVTGNATLQYDASGTFACILNGAITGNANSTLTINSAFATSFAMARLRLYGVFTNDANIVLTSAGQTVVQMAPYLPSGNQVYNGVISGTQGHLLPRGAGNVIFNNTNTFIDNTGLSIPVGYSTFVSGGNVGIGADSVSSSPPTIDASPVGIGLVGINVGPESGNVSFFANGGPHTIANQFAFVTTNNTVSTTNTVTVAFSGSNDLTLSGEFDLALSGDTFGTNRTFDVSSTGATTLSGVVDDFGHGCSITKTGGGALYLNGADTYSGGTTNTGGLLAGSGSIAGPVDVESGGSLGGGPAHAIGTLTINNNLTLNGNMLIRVDKDLSPGQSNDMISVTGSLSASGNGVVVVTNTGATALATGDSFQIFNGPVSGANTLLVAGGGMVWTNMLSINGSIAALSNAPPVATNSTNITFSISNGTNLSLSWPEDHLGWTLLTNRVGLTSSSNWFAFPNSAYFTNENLIIEKTQSNVFFRMVLQVP